MPERNCDNLEMFADRETADKYLKNILEKQKQMKMVSADFLETFYNFFIPYRAKEFVSHANATITLFS